ncbi:MAG: hypothetical protein LBD54_01570 [Puniceicoccales bacterium]|jgi:hypothetical protein|nr:hypothetical protein [Puniceicoccales bacterium]
MGIERLGAGQSVQTGASTAGAAPSENIGTGEATQKALSGGAQSAFASVLAQFGSGGIELAGNFQIPAGAMGTGTLEAHYEGQAGHGLRKYSAHFQKDLAVAGEAFGNFGLEALGKELASPAASPGFGVRMSMEQVVTKRRWEV